MALEQRAREAAAPIRRGSVGAAYGRADGVLDESRDDTTTTEAVGTATTEIERSTRRYARYSSGPISCMGTPERIDRAEDGVIVVFDDGDRLPLPGISRVEIAGHAHEVLTFAVIPHEGFEADARASVQTLATLFVPYPKVTAQFIIE